MTLGSIALEKPIIEIFGVEGCRVFNFAVGSLVVKGKDFSKIESFLFSFKSVKCPSKQ